MNTVNTPQDSTWLNTFRHIGMRLVETPLLSGWLIVGPLVAGFLEGITGLVSGYINVLLLGMWAVLIYRMTANREVKRALIKKPGQELTISLILFSLLFLLQSLDFNVITVDPFRSGVQTFFDSLREGVYALTLPEWLQSDVFIAVSSSIKQLFPTLLVFILLGYGWRDMGIRLTHGRLTLVLIALTMLFGLASGALFRAPIYQIVILYVVGLFVNALPEELLFRGLILPRLEALMSNPLNALVVTALLFNLLHVPIEISRGTPLVSALAQVFAIGFPSGLIWGYLYLRTRSILPGVFWHGANVTLGYFMLSL